MLGNLRPLKVGQRRLSAGDYNLAMAEVQRLGHITCDAPLELVSNGTGYHMRVNVPYFWARITAGSNPYSFVELSSQGNGSFDDLDGGRTGSLIAWEVNGSLVNIGDRVMMWSGKGDEFFF